MRPLIIGIVFNFLFLSNSYAETTLKVVEAWAKPTLGAMPVGAAYLTLENTGKEDVILNRATSASAENAEIHTMAMEGNIARMRKLPHVVVPAGETVTMAPGGMHIMLMGLRQPLKAGDRFPLTLVFDTQPVVEVEVEVK